MEVFISFYVIWHKQHRLVREVFPTFFLTSVIIIIVVIIIITIITVVISFVLTVITNIFACVLLFTIAVVVIIIVIIIIITVVVAILLLLPLLLSRSRSNEISDYHPKRIGSLQCQVKSRVVGQSGSFKGTMPPRQVICSNRSSNK